MPSFHHLPPKARPWRRGSFYAHLLHPLAHARDARGSRREGLGDARPWVKKGLEPQLPVSWVGGGLLPALPSSPWGPLQFWSQLQTPHEGLHMQFSSAPQGSFPPPCCPRASDPQGYGRQSWGWGVGGNHLNVSPFPQMEVGSGHVEIVALSRHWPSRDPRQSTYHGQPSTSHPHIHTLPPPALTA